MAALLPMIATVLGVQCTASHSTSSYAIMTYIFRVNDCEYLGSWSWKNISLASLTIAKEPSFSSLPLTSRTLPLFITKDVGTKCFNVAQKLSECKYR